MSGYHKIHEMLGGKPFVRVASREQADRKRSEETKERLDDLLELNRAAVESLRKAVGTPPRPDKPGESPQRTSTS